MMSSISDPNPTTYTNFFKLPPHRLGLVYLPQGGQILRVYVPEVPLAKVERCLSASRLLNCFLLPHIQCTIAAALINLKNFAKAGIFPPLTSHRNFRYPNRRHGAGRYCPPRDPRFPITLRKPRGFKLENSNFLRPITQGSSSSISAAKRIRGIQVLDLNSLALIILSLGP